MLFFFSSRRRHTRYWRDWSSDVCSSDLVDKFEKPYKKLLDGGVKFYAALGNHDEPAQRFYKPFNMDGKRFYKFDKGDIDRSEERRVGKECRSRWSPYH